MSDRPTLMRMPVAKIVAFWRPGSGDDAWTWKDEYDDLTTRRDAQMRAIRERVASEGFGFADEFAPVLLSSDGRVWDGHHRICLAIEADVHALSVELVEPEEQEQ